MEEVIVQHIAQLGAAGLMGLLWIVERRHSSQRERELTEAHQKLVEQRIALDGLLELVRENTRASTRLADGQTRLAQACENVVSEVRQIAATLRPISPLDKAG